MADSGSIKIDLTDLVSSLTKFLAWNDEYAEILERYAPDDAAGHLMKTLGIPAEDVLVLIGGSNAPILKRAADEIRRLRELMSRAMTGLKTLGEFHYPEDRACDPHSLDCLLAGRVSRVFGTGMARSCELCREFGQDPNYSEADKYEGR